MVFITTPDLAERWRCSTRKIEQQRVSGTGPAYLKIGKQVLYDLSVIETYEAENTFHSTTEHDVASCPTDSRDRERRDP